MELTILGSAAAEGIPAIFCECETCRQAWKNGGKDFRMRTAYKLNDRVRIDFGPDFLAQEHRFNLHSENLRHLIITHPHEDHLYADALDYRHPGLSVVDPEHMLTVYGNDAVIQEIRRKLICGDRVDARLKFVCLRPFHPVEIPEEDITLHPLQANHWWGGNSNIHLMRQGKQHLLIANDTGWFPEATWEYLEKMDCVLDILIMDCTGGPYLDNRDYHMCGKVPVEVRDRLLDMGRIDSRTQVYVNHFSHNGHATHAQLEAFYNPKGIQVGYDGCVINA